MNLILNKQNKDGEEWFKGKAGKKTPLFVL